jgi:hypothetical protein
VNLAVPVRAGAPPPLLVLCLLVATFAGCASPAASEGQGVAALSSATGEGGELLGAPLAEAPPRSQATFSERVLTDSPSFISDVARDPDRSAVPGGRPAPLLEIGDPYHGQGQVQEGVELPGGAVVNPSLLVYGTFRSSIQTFDDGLDAGPQGGKATSEWANRLDVFANLRLTATERFLIGFRPLDGDRGFSGFQFEPDPDDGWKEALDGTVRTAFFEGDLGEILPDLDRDDDSLLDFGFSVGRQQLLFQDGILINGTMDAFGLTRNSLRFLPGLSNVRSTFVIAVPDLFQPARGDGRHLLGLFNAFDATVLGIETSGEVDAAYVNSRDAAGQGVFLGVGFTQRLGSFNTTFRYNGSFQIGEDDGSVENGSLLTAEIALDIGADPLVPDILYLNLFAGIDRYRSAFRSADAGTPLGRVGILFAAPGIGRYGSVFASQDALDGAGHALTQADRSLGFALGYQAFLGASHRQQLIFELAGRRSTADGVNNGVIGLGARYQIALGQHVVVLAETFAALLEGEEPAAGGGRLEFLFKF